MVLDGDILDRFYVFGQLAQESRTSNTSHILQTDLVTSGIDQLLSHFRVILHGMDWRIGDAKTTLRDHATIVCIFDGRDDVTGIVQTTERTGDISTLFLLNHVEEFADICRNRAHTKSVQRAVQHVCLNTSLMERLGPLADCLIRILSVKEVHLLKSTTICFYSVEAAHLHDYGRYFHQLVDAWYILTCGLPHVSEYETEFYFFSHFY